MLKSKHIGIAIISIALLLGAVLYTFSIQSIESSTQQCEAELQTTCPHQGYLPPQTVLGILLLIGLGGLGSFLAIQKEPAKISLKSKIDLKALDKDERVLYKTLMDSGGTIFQSELMEKLGLSKVKVTRLLDRLEAKNILERRRRGMTNIVMLKNN